MPRPAINDYIFYKIVNVNADVDLCYVGSTANWKHRMYAHKHTCNNPNALRHNLKLYKTIREHGGWDEFKMVEIGRAEQLTLTEAHQKEEEYRVELQANMNSQKCFIDTKEVKKQYRIDNADKFKEYAKQYRIDNADTIKQKAKQYRVDNADKVKEWDKQWRIKNHDKHKERCKQWRIDNADRVKQYRIDYADRSKQSINPDI